MRLRLTTPGLAILLLYGVFAFGARPVHGQDSKGTDFWLGFNRNNDTTSVELTLFITSSQNGSGTVAVPGLAFSTPFNVTAGTVTSVIIPSTDQVAVSDSVVSRGIHVTSDVEVTVYGLNRKPQTTDAYLGLPLDILGTDYIVLAYQNSFANFVANSTQFLLVGAVDGTTVTITPTVTTGARLAGVPYNVALNAGDAYQLNNLSLPGDLTGTTITANQPVAVYGGHSCVNIPPQVSFCDHIVEQLPPTSAWGEEFVTVPLATRLNGDTFRILAAQDGTNVSINGVMVATLNRGQFHEQIIATASRISATGPVLVAQYSNGTNFDGITSDPFMMLIPPFEQFLGNYTVTTPGSGFDANFINVVAPSAAVGAITLDTVAIPPGSFSAIGATGFSGAQVAVTLGSHTLDGPLPFGVFMYGFDDFDSYGYPGGQSLASVAIVTSLDLTPPSSSPTVGTEQCLTAHVADQNGAAVPGVRVDFAVTGANPMTSFSFANGSGDAQLCYTAANAGLDSVVASVGALSDDAAVNWQAAQVGTPTETPTSTPTNTGAPATDTPSPTSTNTPSSTPTTTDTPSPTSTNTPTPTPTTTDTPVAQSPSPTRTRPPIPVVSSPASPAGVAMIITLLAAMVWVLRFAPRRS